MNFPPKLRFLYRSFQVHLFVVFVVVNFVYICHIPTEQLFVWYIFKVVKHVVYHYNKFSDLYIIGEKKRRKKWLETNLSQWLSKIYRNLLSTWSYYHKWYRLSTSACTYSSMTPPPPILMSLVSNIWLILSQSCCDRLFHCVCLVNLVRQSQ